MASIQPGPNLRKGTFYEGENCGGLHYLTSRPSRDLIIASHQQITREWWEKRRDTFHLYISQLVVDEASAGDPVAARERLKVVQDLPLLDITPEVAELASGILASGKVPRKAATDAAHIAI